MRDAQCHLSSPQKRKEDHSGQHGPADLNDTLACHEVDLDRNETEQICDQTGRTYTLIDRTNENDLGKRIKVGTFHVYWLPSFV